MKDRDKANSAAFGCTKMQFFICNRPRKSQGPHTSHSWPMRLMQKIHHHQAKLSELPPPPPQSRFSCSWERSVWEPLAEVRAEVLGREELPAQSQMDPMSISFAIYNVSKNSTRGAQSTPIQPGSLAMSLLAMPSISAENAMATVDQRNFHHPTLPTGQN